MTKYFFSQNSQIVDIHQPSLNPLQPYVPPSNLADWSQAISVIINLIKNYLNGLIASTDALIQAVGPTLGDSISDLINSIIASASSTITAGLQEAVDIFATLLANKSPPFDIATCFHAQIGQIIAIISATNQSITDITNGVLNKTITPAEAVSILPKQFYCQRFVEQFFVDFLFLFFI